MKNSKLSNSNVDASESEYGKRVRISCPVCNDTDLVRARIPIYWGLVLGVGARYLSCGNRFRLTRREFVSIPLGYPGLPYEKAGDRYWFALTAPMTRIQEILAVIGVLISAVIICVALAVWHEPLVGVIVLPTVLIFWWLGFRIRAPERNIPHRCPDCGYSLRGLGGNQCPECGTSQSQEKSRKGSG